MKHSFVFRLAILGFSLCGLTIANASDTFAGAPLVAINSNTTLATSSSGKQPGEPVYIGKGSMWYRYIVPTRGIVRITTTWNEWSDVHIFRGSSIDKLNLVTSGHFRFGGTVTFPAEAGMEFRIALSTDSSSSVPMSFTTQQNAWPYGSGTVVVPSVPTSTVPGNDEFENSTVIPSSASPVQVIAYNVDASQNGLGPEPARAGYHTLWYRWTAPKTGIAKVSSPASPMLGFAHRMTVYRGNQQTALNLVEEDYDNYWNSSLTVSFPVVVGSEYRICFGSYYSDDDEGGPVVFTVRTESWPFGSATAVAPLMPNSDTPRNDQFENATNLPSKIGGKYTVVDYNRSATTLSSSFEPEPIGYQSLWYKWTAPETTYVTFSTPASPVLGYSHKLAGYSGSSYENLTPLGAAPGAYNGGARIGFAVTKGKTYRISFGTYSSSILGGPVIINYESGAHVNPSGPKCTITSPTKNGSVSKSGFYLSGTIGNDLQGIRAVQLKVNGKLVYNREANGAGNISIATGRVKKGKVTVELRAQDGYGRWGNFVKRTFTAK